MPPRIAIVTSVAAVSAIDATAAVMSCLMTVPLAVEDRRQLAWQVAVPSRSLIDASPAATAVAEVDEVRQEGERDEPTMTMITSRAPTVTTAAAFVRDQPRARILPTYGENVAAITTATKTDAITVDRTTAS